MENNRKKVIRVSIVTTFMLTAVFLNSFTVIAASEPEYKSKYIGQEKREIKTLSSEDINELRTGAGWGLAKAAELNGLPGPKHVLDMKKEIGLTVEQEKMIIALFKDMKEESIKLGNTLIEYEKELNDRFAERNIDEKVLEELLNKISETYRSLRYVHLSAHLKTPDILSEDQIRQYNELRGYSSDEPCENIPQGHDPAMWRRHNNCE
jgi:hypothetical protein